MPTDIRFRCRQPDCRTVFRVCLADAPNVMDCPVQECDGIATADAKLRWSSRTGYQPLEGSS